jgi:AraC-like DNA-binding protein
MPVEPTITILSAIILLGIFQGVLFAGLLIFVSKGHQHANFLLALILLFFSLTLSHQFLVDTGYIQLMPNLIGFTMPLEAFYGPLLFRYVQTLTQPELDLTINQRLRHFILPVASSFLSIPFFRLDYEQKLNMIEQGYSSSAWEGLVKITMPIQMSIFGVLFTVYLIACYLRLHRHNQAITGYFSFREKITLSWLRNLLILMLVFWILMAVYIAVISSSDLTSELIIVLSLFTVFSILYIGVMGLLQPRIFPIRGSNTGASADISSKQDSEAAPDIETEEEFTQSKGHESEKYKHSALSTTDIERIAAKITTLMETEKPYLENNLTLPDLAKSVGVSSNYLSQVINDHFHLNFFDFVNSYRIKLASDLLIKPDNTTGTVLDIAMAAAFNSKSAFYSAFKKQTGMTPLEFKKSSASL